MIHFSLKKKKKNMHSEHAIGQKRRGVVDMPYLKSIVLPRKRKQEKNRHNMDRGVFSDDVA
jgi:hypothetical protein